MFFVCSSINVFTIEETSQSVCVASAADAAALSAADAAAVSAAAAAVSAAAATADGITSTTCSFSSCPNFR